MENIPNKMVSGLSTEMLDFATTESNERYLKELDAYFLQKLQNLEKMDQTLTIEQERQLNELEMSGNAKSSDEQTKRWVREFKLFLCKEQLCENFETVPPNVLNDYLRLFYASLKKKDGTYYAPSSLVCVRAAIHRYLTSPKINASVNILNDETFRRANGILKAMIKKYLTSNQPDKENQYQRIKEEDLRKIKTYFASKNDTITLQQECLFNIMFHFQLRGRENLRDLKQNTFKFDVYDDSREYVFINTAMLQKNVKASVNRKHFENLKEAKMITQPNSQMCPVKRLKEYLGKLPNTKDNCLFPGVKKDGSFSSNTVLGKDKLGNFIKNLSKAVGLDTLYTNHCLRVTGINMMHEAGMTPEEIASVTGHKDNGSVQRYLRRNNRKLIRASDILAQSVASKEGTQAFDGNAENTVSLQMQSEKIDDECSNIQLTTMHQLKISRKMHDDSAEEPTGKKARLHTSWGVLEIDL